MERRVLLPSMAIVLAFATGVVRAGDNHPAISADEIRKAVDKLAGEDFLGREAGSEGGRAAADWLAAECEKVGLKPAGDDGTFFQTFKASGRQMRNVVATLPAQEGSEVADEVVVVGSHYDHLGKGGHGALDFMSGGGKVHYGADDNASGSTGNLMLARALAAAGPAKRRIVFVWFDGEELGLFGSKHYVKKPPFPLKKTAAMLNMDMIGRLRKDKLTVYGINTGDTFAAIEKRAVEGSDLKCELKDTMPPNSDHFSFYEKKVPVVALFTGLHKDYHRATDTAEKVEVEGMVKILRYAYRLVRGLADDEARAVFAQAKDGNAEAMFEQILAMLDEDQIKKIFGDEESLQKLFKENGLGKVMEKLRGTGLFGGGGGRRPRFGVSTQEAEDGTGLVIVRVTENSIAARSGVKEGDKILSFDGKRVHDVGGLTEAIRAAKGKVTVVIERDGITKELEAEFAASAARPQPPAADPKKRWF